MPPSSSQDNAQTTSSEGKPGKAGQKTSGVQTPTKNGRKNGTAKDGGIMAAVKKDAKANNRFTPQSTPSKSPDMKPNGSPPNENPISSPLLDALSTAAIARTSAQNTTDWTRNVPVDAGYSSSPNNLIHLGESPPTVPSSYEDRLSNFGWNTREQRGIPPSHFHSASPPAPNRRRPLSYHHIDRHTYQGPEDHRSQGSAYSQRRSSMYAQQARYGAHPPLPHQTQAHFYGAPDVNLLSSPAPSGLTPGDNGYYCGFDKLPSQATSEYAGPVENVVVTGYEGGLYVNSVTKRGLKRIANVDGLRGGVYNAKILPWIVRGPSNELFPLVAVVIHGPVWSTKYDSNSEDEAVPEQTLPIPTGSAPGSPRPASRTLQEVNSIDCYQTSVEVYSILTNRHVATLLHFPRIPLSIPTSSPMFRPPPPVGSLAIRADCSNLVVSSGSTGETWIFRQGNMNSPEKFRCTGKVWTMVQQGVTVEATGPRGPVDGDWSASEPDAPPKPFNASVLSLSGRFLAYCPPAPSSQVSLRATVVCNPVNKKVPGLVSHAPPQLPTVNCLVETPGGESMVKQILQLGTQKFIEGATYLGGQGVQAWNNYWNKSAPGQTQQGGLSYQANQTLAHHFPPTHATSATTPAAPKEPGLISILDLESLAQPSSQTSHAIHPAATFRVPHGCSFLSFAPSGLALFTASSKGDVQFVWDLMRMQFAKSSFLKGSLQSVGIQSPHVRQIAQFSRMTIARIVDVVWTAPYGERAAMVTEPGTVHILDLPASAFTWPPPRRKLMVTNPEDRSSEVGLGLTASGVASSASSAVTSLWTAARPLVSRRRRSTAGMSVTAQAGHGTQVLAAGISRSVGAATGRMNEMRKSGNTKLHLPKSAAIPSRSCVMLLGGKKGDSVIVVGGGVVGFYTIKNRQADRPADKQKALRGAKYVEFRLPTLPDPDVVSEASCDGAHVGDLELTEGDLEERFQREKSPLPASRQHGTESSIPQAEIESNAPYQPFHTDRRVALHVISHEESTLPSPTISTLLNPPKLTEKSSRSKPAAKPSTKPDVAWAFGGPIKSTRLDIGLPLYPDEDLESPSEHRALPSSAIERVLRVTDSNEDMEQIVITTRRRKGISRADTDGEGDAPEEGFFEDDCEVLDFASQRV